MVNSRSKKAILNTMSAFAMEAVTMACGLVVPRLILSCYGSAYNGIISSITHFLSYVILMKAGLGGVTRAALYKPLAEDDSKVISEVLFESERYIRKVAFIFLGGVIVFSTIYPLVISADFSWGFTCSLFLIISITTFINYYFCYARSVLLEADQKIYVWNIAVIISTLLNTLFSVILIKIGTSIHVVKLGSAAAYVVTPLITYAYTNKHYSIDRKVKSNNNHIVQRWDAFAHEAASFINSNIDVIVLSIFLDIREVSVYTVYAYVTTALNKLTADVVTSFHAAFGDMYAKKEYDLMQENLGIFELIVFSVTAVIYSVALVMITPFSILYTRGVTDVSYNRPLFGALLVFSGAFMCFRTPYVAVTTAVGHFKQTKKISYFEAILNVVISICCVIKWGIIGVTAGTLIAAVFSSAMLARYLSRNILTRSMKHYYMHVLAALGIMAVMYLVGNWIMPDTSTVLLWIGKAMVLSVLGLALTFGVDMVFWRKDIKMLFYKLIRVVRLNRNNR